MRRSMTSHPLLGSFLLPLALLAGILGSGMAQAQDIPQPEEAFEVSAEAVGPETVRLTWDVGDDTYLYRDKLDLSVVEPEGGEVAATEVPRGKEKYDETFGEEMEVFYDEATLTAELSGVEDADEVVVEARYQGCAEAGVCYPPQTEELTVSLADAPADGSSADGGEGAAAGDAGEGAGEGAAASGGS
ncbi:MAG: protein-disulfide reductase DsbD N-terminal domain-containing protein, partial [Thiohalorhabdus sp.]|uniref:protein-disulfide reductase DsbD N-terminal domain-containing protein n=1 Tax=Thiohalorhabdus sp. TaxID=3094134 RepID=UPI00397F4248